MNISSNRGPLYLPRGGREKFGVGRRARSAPRRGMKIFVSGGKFGTPAKQRSRSISTRKREVMERISVLSANTYLRTLSNAAPFQLRFWESNCHLLHQFLPRVPVGGIWSAYSVIGSLSHTGKLELAGARIPPRRFQRCF